MKSFLHIIILVSINIFLLNATAYEDAEDGLSSRWTITDSEPVGAIVSNIYDDKLKSNVIELKGRDYDNQYRIGNLPLAEGAWNERSKFYFSWNIKNESGFFIDVILETKKGLRYLRYNDDDSDRGLDDDMIYQGVGYDAANGSWHTFKRDLEADLQEYELDNEIISVNGLLIRGDCSLDNIVLDVKPSNKEFVMYEDAEDKSSDRWTITDNIPVGAVVRNIYDNEKKSRVIELETTDSYENQFSLVEWNNLENFNLGWEMKTVEGFIIDIEVLTTLGTRYLRYLDNDFSFKEKNDDTLSYGLGYHSTDGTWHSYKRNLLKDLQLLEAGNTIVSVKSFSIRAKGTLDNIELFTSPNHIYENAEDGLNTRWRVYLGPDNAKIKNVSDPIKKSKVISLEGNSYENQYIIGDEFGAKASWANSKHHNIKWSMQNSGGFIIYLFVNTQKGLRQIKYDDNDFIVSGTEEDEIYYGLGYDSSDGEWHTFIRDIAADVTQFDQTNKLLSIEGFLVIGSAKIDDLELFNIFKDSKKHKSGLALTFDDFDVDGWYSLRNTYIDYGVKATFFVSHFHTLSAFQLDRLKTLEEDGHEIGSHTFNHRGIGRDFNYDDTQINEYLLEQIIPAYNNMKEAGFNPVSFAYPYGERSISYDNAVKNYFPYLRTTASDNERSLSQLEEIYHKGGKQYSILAGDGIDNSYANKIEEIREAFIKTRENGEIITLYAHEVLDDIDNPYAISPQKLEKLIQIAQEVGLKFYTFKEAYEVGK